MIHYHGTPIGGRREDAAKRLAGRHALVPFPRQDDIDFVAEACKSFVFDNGAFSVWKKGGELDVDGYTRWVEEWHRHPGFTWALIPDVIDDNEEANDSLVRQWPEELCGVPVWHLHESLDQLQRLERCWRTVAIGSSGQRRSPGTAAWLKRMAAAIDSICDEHGRPICRLHGLRMLDPAIFSALALHLRRLNECRSKRRQHQPIRHVCPAHGRPEGLRHR
ncbi:hypothetical protein [Pseudomonas cichorii]|uniref:hypothetical protein n=1 Tax=Pseudomonas cichorii TaxID=36746 RepID=UPI001F453CDF|nr:hypothetical protein [Pseudomonas cichorii]